MIFKISFLLFVFNCLILSMHMQLAPVEINGTRIAKITQLKRQYLGCFNEDLTHNNTKRDLNVTAYDLSYAYQAENFRYINSLYYFSYTFFEYQYLFNSTDSFDKTTAGVIFNWNVYYAISNLNCMHVCQKRGFVYAGTQNGICHCGNSYGKYGASTSKCSVLCLNNLNYKIALNALKTADYNHTYGYNTYNVSLDWYDSTLPYEFPDTCNNFYDKKSLEELRVCGDESKNSIYKINATEKIIEYSLSYLGCYTLNDTGESIFLTSYSDWSNMTISKCVEYCMKFNLNLAQLTLGSNCLCGNVNATNIQAMDTCFDLPDFISKEDETKCDIKCPGSISENCGGNHNYKYEYIQGNQEDSNTTWFATTTTWFATTRSIYQYNYTGSLYLINYISSFERCPDGYASSNGYEPNCVKSSINFNAFNKTAVLKPVSGYDDPLANLTEVLFKCFVNCPAGIDCKNINGTVEWFNSTDSKTYFKQTSLNYNPKENVIYSFLHEADWTPLINTALSCKISPTVNGLRPYFDIVSNSYFAGIECEMISVKNEYSQKINQYTSMYIKEGDLDGYSIKCFINLPILCNSKTDMKLCKLQFKMKISGDYDFYQLVSKNQCLQKISQSHITNKNKLVSWNIISTVETNNLNNFDQTYRLEILVNGTVNTTSSFLNLLKTPDITVYYYTISRMINSGGSSFNDPHCITFDGQSFELQMYGEFVMYENEDAQMRVHMLTYDCYSNRIFCIAGVYIQSIDDLISINLNDGIMYYRNMRIENSNNTVVPWKDGKALIETNGVSISREGLYFVVKSHYGATVKIYESMGQFYIIPSKSDANKVNGCFGNNNKNLTDDFIYLRKSVTLAKNNAEFFDSYNAFKVDDIPKMSKGESYPFNEFVPLESEDSDEDGSKQKKNKVNFCQCQDDFEKNQDNICANNLDEDTFKLKKSKSKRSAEEEQEILIPKHGISVNDPSLYGLRDLHEHENRKRRQKRATTDETSCDKIKNPAFKAADDLKIIDIDKIFSLCVEDYKSAPNENWIDTYMPAFNNLCKTSLLNDKSNWETVSGSTVSSPRSSILMDLCPNNCSQNGVCSGDGTCTCDKNFLGSDCSLDLSKIPNLLKTLYQDNTVYLSTNEQLKHVFLNVNDFIPDAPDSSVIGSINVENGSLSFEATYLNGLSLSKSVIFVNLTDYLSDKNVSNYTLSFQVSNNKIDFSNLINLKVITKGITETVTQPTVIDILYKQKGSIIMPSLVLNLLSFFVFKLKFF